MSLLPLPKVVSGPLKQRRYPPDVAGTPNISYGHRLQERSNCQIAKCQKGRCFFDGQEERPEDKREYEQLLKTYEFVKHTDRRIGKKKIWQRVQQGMAAYEETVNARREKLRDLILNEETNLTREVIEQAQHGDDARMDEMRSKSEDLRKRQEDKRLAVVAAKRMQQYLARCPEVRAKLSKKSVHDAKASNVVQMADNEARRDAEKELDRLWHELMLKEIDAKKHREIEEAKRRALVERETMTALAEQMAGKLALEEEKKQRLKEEREKLECLWQTVRREESKNLESERTKREALKRDLEEQIVIAKRHLAERARQEAEMDRKLKTIAEEQLSKEKAAIKESSAALRKELLAYLQYLEDIRREEAKRNVEVDAIIEASSRDANARRDLAVKKFKEIREKDLREVLRGRDEQVRLKREKEEEEMESRRMEREILEREIELDAKLIVQAREEGKRRALLYQRDLKEQQKRREDTRRWEIETEERIRREESIREREEYEKLTEELLAASENITPHPFKVLLKECAARYAAEKMGECYCPPPISLE